uniref:Uncharacterized protein n=1 Tax=Candidatus Kentrum sp. SD TaxID=2126332 RepID=A0A451BLU6_9GAMM|nr:MAG: hypothetical protein BECKSD772D_GA0070982_10416 [Candidatus Kentron sp. SD]
MSPDGQASVTIDTGGGITTHDLPAGQVVTVNAGPDNTVSTVITSDAPILVAHMGIDGAGLPTDYLNMRFGLPVDAQYVVVVCPWPNTTVILRDGANPPQEKTCNGNGYPGKVYFGSDVEARI